MTEERLEQALFEIRRVIAGQDAMLERVLVCLLAQGHLLIEGVPGLAKTLTIKTTAQRARRLVRAYPVHPGPRAVPTSSARASTAPTRATFDTELGPVFCNFLLADEINRAPAKVQSALLEVMQERQVTIGAHDAPGARARSSCIATQNPIESEGTYPLPEAQVDRFMLKVLIDYPEHDEELTIVQRQLVAPPELREMLSLDALRALQAAVVRRLRRSGAHRATRSRSPPRRGVPADAGLAELAGLRLLRREPARPDQRHRRPPVRSRCSAAATTRWSTTSARSRRTRSGTGSCSATRRSPKA